MASCEDKIAVAALRRAPENMGAGRKVDSISSSLSTLELPAFSSFCFKFIDTCFRKLFSSYARVFLSTGLDKSIQNPKNVFSLGRLQANSHMKPRIVKCL